MTFDYVLVTAEDDVATADYEVWELDGDELRPLDLVEEVLIMALPMAAAHDSIDRCGPLAGQLAATDTVAPDTVRPFAGLREQMDNTE